MPFLVPEDFKRDLLARTDMLALIGPHTQLKRSGSTHKGLCPLHREKSPSFHVRPELGTFKCFGCGEGGDAITFLRELQGYSFLEAVEELAARGREDAGARAGGGAAIGERPGAVGDARGSRGSPDVVPAAGRTLVRLHLIPPAPQPRGTRGRTLRPWARR